MGGLISVFSRMVRRMLKLKRKPQGNGVEPWLDYNIRSFRRAKRNIKQHSTMVSTQLALDRNAFAEHLARFGVAGRDAHLAKRVVL